jgi:hypothetical protein
MVDVGFLIIAIACVWIVVFYRERSRRLKGAEFIRAYQWPPGLLDKLGQKHPALAGEDTALISRGLRQFFLAYLLGGKKFVAMPSRIVDDLWHEFILYTREYEQFCAKAFGRFMHHTPAVAMGPAAGRRIADGLYRAWWFACKDENIDPKQANRLPLLFALDGELQIPNGFRYGLDCDAFHREGVTDVHFIADLTADGCGD